MDFDGYQDEAQGTDRVPAPAKGEGDLSLIVPLLGLAGEAGGLLSEYKKFLRDGSAHKLFKQRVAEELGDILWYVANIAQKFDLRLGEIAVGNLAKIKDRWETAASQSPLLIPKAYDYDSGYPREERFPRQMDVELRVANKDGKEVIQLLVDGVQCGDDLTDNAYTPDGYGFHDVLHFAHAAVLGWSPVLRKLLGCKRKSNRSVDEVEDGGRAGAIEEGLAAIIFDYARSHNFFEGVRYVDYELLRTLKSAAQHLEVRRCALVDWQSAILQGYAIWRPIAKARGGKFRVDLDGRAVTQAG
jgi:NTP pyrophosphatase (non-canonical NTP hydrolase)